MTCQEKSGRESCNLWRVNWVLSSGWLMAHALWAVEQRGRRSPAASKVKALGFRQAIGGWPETNRRLRSADHSHWPLWPCEATTRSEGSGFRRGHEATSWSKNGGWARCGANWIQSNLRLQNYHFWLRIEGKTLFYVLHSKSEKSKNWLNWIAICTV